MFGQNKIYKLQFLLETLLQFKISKYYFPKIK